MENKQAMDELHLHLDALTQSCQGFEVILQKEFESLKDSNTDDLLDSIAEKQTTLDRLFQQETKLRAYLKGSFKTPLRELLQHFLETLTDLASKAKLQEKLGYLIELLEKCKLQNQINGGIINHNLELNQRIIQALIKPAKPVSTGTYNEKGKVE